MIPPRSILTTTDFSEASRSALVFAACLARQCGAQLHLVHAEEPLLAAAARRAGVDLGADTREALQSFVTSTPAAREYAPMHHVVTGQAAEAIVETAATEHADLIVIGSRGTSMTARLLFGSTAERVVRHARTSVVVVPHDWKPAHPESLDLSGTGPVIAAVDFSTSSIEAAAAACRLAATLGTGIEIVHVVPDVRVPPRWRREAEEAMAERVAAARREMDEVRHQLPASNGLQTRIEVGNVVECLAAITASEGGRHPLLVLGRQPGRRGMPPGALAYQLLSIGTAPTLTFVPPETSDTHR